VRRKWRSALCAALITASAGGRKLRAVAFVVNHAHPHYAAASRWKPSPKRWRRKAGSARADYLPNVDCLADYGIRLYLIGLREKALVTITA
jgi:hypothetical protein